MRPLVPSLAATLAPRAFMALSASLLLLAGCSQHNPALPPLSKQALDAVAIDPGVPRQRLARAVDALFTRTDLGETRAVIVMHDGKIVAERYAKGFGPRTRLVGWSMSKTVTAALIGMLIADGKLALDQPAPIPRWQRTGDPRGAITVRDLLQMRSGLKHTEMGHPIYTSDEVRMLYLDGRNNMAGWAEAQPLVHDPGRHFQYSTSSAMILADIAARLLAPGGTAAQRQQAVAEFFRARLAMPIGAPSLVAQYDAAGTMKGGSSIWATARDWARFGEFLRKDGRVNGAQVVPRGWIAFMTAPDPAAPDYGAMVWRNVPSGTKRKVLFPDRGPPGLFAAVGHLGQYILVSPRQGLTVVRLGKTEGPQERALVDALADLVALYPVRK